jgi:hypothetical protein
MSAPLFRRAVAIAAAAGLAGLSLAACSTKNDDNGSSAAGGRVAITVDCQPVAAQAELLKNWVHLDEHGRGGAQLPGGAAEHPR